MPTNGNHLPLRSSYPASWKNSPIAINHGELEKTAGLRQHVAPSLSLSLSLFLRLAFRAIQVGTFASFYPMSRRRSLQFAVFIPLPMIFSSPLKRARRLHRGRPSASVVTRSTAAISSLLPLNAIPYDRSQASESHLITRCESHGEIRREGVEPRFKSIHSSNEIFLSRKTEEYANGQENVICVR